MNWRVYLIVAAVLAGCLSVSAQAVIVGQPTVTEKRAWGPEQATGAPDTPEAGDFPSAWASLLPDAGPEWLQLDFARPVIVKEVRIRETFNPGAVTKVTAFEDGGKEKTLWEGEDPTKKVPEDFVVNPVEHLTTKRLKIYLDSKRVPGWNEIDAVEMIGMDATRQWAVKASASSTYAERPYFDDNMIGSHPFIGPVALPEDEFHPFLNRAVIFHLPGEKSLEGVLLRSGTQFLVLRNEAAQVTYVINKAQVVFAEIKGGALGQK